ncbi:hypothetical protein NBRC111894_2610 [Sporolactobacillus inulinus]|uniref:Uncharacterized protein n=1 Tax=Sporolactobacillus inulinus TaxID=2078 RepID=A0A4Y1ZD83_9BACL|nr:hypothetical protein NBRC111894_2610 [Sporolactobacillus inulinus]
MRYGVLINVPHFFTRYNMHCSPSQRSKLYETRFFNMQTSMTSFQ